MSTITAEDCVAHLGDALSNRPQALYSEAAAGWFADVVGIVSAYDTIQSMSLSVLLGSISCGIPSENTTVSMSLRRRSCNEFVMRARSIYTQLRLTTNAFQTKHLNPGEVYDYFDEIRNIISGSTEDILFTDPYINPEFISRYLPQVPQQVHVRLLTSAGQFTSLRESVMLYTKQHNAHIEIRNLPNKTLHDRHLVIDKHDVYQSGASFKDGAKTAPTVINQIVDTATELVAALEARWDTARVT